MARRLVDRLDDMAIRSDESHDDDEDQDDGCGEGRFPLALDLGSGPGYVYDALCDSAAFDDDQDEGSLPRGGIGGVRKLVQLDSSLLQLNRYAEGGPGLGGRHHRPLPPPCDTYRLEWDEESLPLPFPTGTFDLVISSGSLHWVNDLPGVFSEVHRVLKPDGCFLLAMAGGASLPELRACLVMAEMERDGGVSPRVGPFVQLSDVGALLQRAGFALPTLDVDTIQLSYPHAGVLMEHLQRMGESNACLSRRRDHTSLDVFLSAACLYAHLFPLRDDGYEMGTTMKGGVSQGGPILAPEIEASVQIIYAIGWTPHHSQQQPRERGSATQKLSDRVNVIKE
jgi:NADH dehydrogenase [ubiquinone] 1 alpha subcomplex assembly factor 5